MKKDIGNKINEELHIAGLSSERQSFRQCKVCSSSAALFEVVDFNRSCSGVNYPLGVLGVPIYYYSCGSCGFVFTCDFDNFKSEAWRRYIYNREYFVKLDSAYESVRPEANARLLQAACRALGRGDVKGIDYGGGNGALSKCMKKFGVAYSTHDPFSDSDVRTVDIGSFNLLSAFEVLEHTTNPKTTIDDMLRYVNGKFVAIISTQCSEGLIDNHKRLAWNYVAPRNGHVSIYTSKAIQLLAQDRGLDYLQITRGTHLIGRGEPLAKLKRAIVWVKIKHRLRTRLLPQSD